MALRSEARVGDQGHRRTTRIRKAFSKLTRIEGHPAPEGLCPITSPTSPMLSFIPDGTEQRHLPPSIAKAMARCSSCVE